MNNIKKLKEYNFPKEVIFILKKIESESHEAFIVGGAIRDILLGREIYDFDITTDASPDIIKNIFDRVVETGIKHGTVTVLEGNYKVEVTTYRKDGEYKDFRRPEKIEYTDKIKEDLKRRDFTINALAYNPVNEKFIDLFNGAEHLKAKRIYAINNPLNRFNEDALRMIRAVRFAVKLDFTIDETVLKAIKKLNKNISKISIERINDEFNKILMSDYPAKGIRLLDETGLLRYFLPELLNCKDVKQNKYHIYDVYEHILHALDNSKNDLVIRLAVLFHDIAKPLTKEVKEDGRITFYNHEIVGAELTEKILKRMKYSNDIIRKVKHLVRYHMFNYTKDWKDGTVRRFINKVGKDYIDYLYEVRKADASAGNPEYKDDLYKELFKRIERLMENENVFSVKDLEINGNDIIKTLNLKPSKKVGVILKDVFDFVLENPENNKKELLLAYIKEKYG